MTAIRDSFPAAPLPDTTAYRAVLGVIHAGLFEITANTGDDDGDIAPSDLRRIASVARIALEAIVRGAAPGIVEDLSLSGFAIPLTADQLEAAARAHTRYTSARVPSPVTQEMTAQALDGAWPAAVTRRCADTIADEYVSGIDPERLALLLIIGVEQDLQATGLDTMISRAVLTARSATDPRYPVYRASVDAGLSPPIALEIYYLALSDGWPIDQLSAVLQGILDAQKEGLSPETTATALIVRIEQEPSISNVAQLVAEEIEFVRNLERDRLATIQADSALANALASEDRYADIIYEPLVRRPETSPLSSDTPLEIPLAGGTDRRPIARTLMERAIDEFMGTPYKWGASRKSEGRIVPALPWGSTATAGYGFPA